ncbi:alpha-L-fucosidase [Leptolyngbya sp. FACHB-261]|uniref:alpha-L-fucosidase n=1 Tax=Leptolyngbya sp. FACHB-261 TaxID=2692806 RepID=UPI001681EACE|nr:alpha-L-fucosidase [Leptolyngbya sp. FACHB-261]MBD2104001.1 alpha-L-fucosidase [Leptolyngbya sp. FACHB-261]
MIKSWFNTARFGMFVHWGHSSQQGCELSWPLVGGVFSLPFCTDIPVEEYQRTAQTFNPQSYDPQQWAALAKQLGMQYVILTAKHHDGFALFHTRQSDFSIEHTPYRKDIVREFVTAMRAEGLRVGLYFSLIDWHHPDYPAFTEADKPYRFGQFRQPSTEQWQRFTQFLFAQLRELLTDYGPIDILWFDGAWERTPEQWQTEAIHKMIRELQPEILINDRLPGYGNFDTPEQFVPAQPPERSWETCLTINESWGYNPADRQFKSARQIIHTLCEAAAKGGNLLLNVSPMGNGQIQPELLERLETVQTWMALHHESILGTQPGLEPWQFYGPSTRKGKRVYLHLLLKPYDSVTVRGVPIRRVKGVQLLSNRKPLSYTSRCAILDSFSRDPLGELVIALSETDLDPHATVLAIDFEDESA